MSSTVVHWGGNTFRFLYDPYNISWQYTLNTKVEDTLGGKVIQILGANLDNLSVSGVCGSYGELERTANFFKELMLWQRDQKSLAKFVYENRGYQFYVVAETFTVEENLTTISYPFTATFKIQEDVSGLATSQSIAKELADIHDGIGYQETPYNMPSNTDQSLGNLPE